MCAPLLCGAPHLDPREKVTSPSGPAEGIREAAMGFAAAGVWGEEGGSDHSWKRGQLPGPLAASGHQPGAGPAALAAALTGSGCGSRLYAGTSRWCWPVIEAERWGDPTAPTRTEALSRGARKGSTELLVVDDQHRWKEEDDSQPVSSKPARAASALKRVASMHHDTPPGKAGVPGLRSCPSPALRGAHERWLRNKEVTGSYTRKRPLPSKWNRHVVFPRRLPRQ